MQPFITLKRFLLITYLATITLLVFGGSVHATPVGPDAQANSLFELDPFTVSALLGTIIPILVGLVTKVSTSSAMKAILNALFSGVAAIINVSVIDGGGAIISQSTVKSAALTFLVSIATYYGIWKPTGVAAQAQAVGVRDNPT